MQRVMEPEFTELALRVATALKIEYLKKLPGMDDAAVALNCSPTHEEHMRVKKTLALVETAGYIIAKADT